MTQALQGKMSVLHAMHLIDIPADEVRTARKLGGDDVGLAAMTDNGWLECRQSSRGLVYSHTPRSLKLRQQLIAAGGSALSMLDNGFNRYLALRVLVNGPMTLRVAAKALRNLTDEAYEIQEAWGQLELRGLVRRVVRGEQPKLHFEYELTPDGEKLQQAFAGFSFNLQ